VLVLVIVLVIDIFLPVVFKKAIPITLEYNPAFDAGLNSTKEIFA